MIAMRLFLAVACAAGLAALSACAAGTAVTPAVANGTSTTQSAIGSGRVTAAAVAVAPACGTTTADAGSLRGLAAGTTCSTTTTTTTTTCATPAPSGASIVDAGSLRGLAAGSDCTTATVCATPAPANGPSAAAGSLRGLAAGGSTCSQANNAPPHSVGNVGGKHWGQQNCPSAGFGAVLCDSFVGNFPSAGRSIVAPATIPGLHPSDLASAYRYFQWAGGGQQTVAVVDAFDDPNAEADLGVFRTEFGLSACTSGSGCFTKIGTSKNPAQLPNANGPWASEIALDLEMVSAVCPRCKILLVEARSDQLADLAAGDDVAAAAGATVISNSYYVPESQLTGASIALISAHYVHPGIPITVSSGDQSYGATFPASMTNVIAVGGTTLVPNTSARGWYETAWQGSGAGCSGYNAKPAWQTDAGCSKRTIVDMAVVADPDTGVAVYDTYGGPGWYVEGGTSVGAPIVASLVALAGNGANLTGASSLYAHAQAMFPIVAGSDGTCAATYLCTAVAGYDGPTGVGSPDGLVAL
jgi:hypothetical protein